MLSLDKLIEIDPSLASLPEDELLEIRKSLYEAAELGFDIWLGSKDPVGSSLNSTEKDTI